jgi:hypothetical protein
MISSNELQVLLFSKDRPWQAKEYLRTFRKYVSADIKPKVIWKASNDAFKKAYEDLWTKGWCEPVSEEEYKGTFKELVSQTIDTAKPYLMFGVDDEIYYRKLEHFEEIKLVLNKCFSYSLRLAPNITFCQPANHPNKLPKLVRVQGAENTLLFNRTEGWGDWDYPFNLTSNIYKTHDVLTVLSNIQFNNPNELEAEGAKLFMGIGNPHAHLNACVFHTLGSIPTINRVQNQFLNELAGPEHSLEELLQLYWSNAEYDEVWYASQKFDRIHIGDFRLKSPKLSEILNINEKTEDIIWDISVDTASGEDRTGTTFLTKEEYKEGAD